MWPNTGNPWQFLLTRASSHTALLETDYTAAVNGQSFQVTTAFPLSIHIMQSGNLIKAQTPSYQNHSFCLSFTQIFMVSRVKFNISSESHLFRFFCETNSFFYCKFHYWLGVQIQPQLLPTATAAITGSGRSRQWSLIPNMWTIHRKSMHAT